MVEAGLIKRSAFINELLPLPLKGMVTADSASLLILLAFKALSMLAEGSGLALTAMAVAQVARHRVASESVRLLRVSVGVLR